MIDPAFEFLMKKYGRWDYIFCVPGTNEWSNEFYRIRHYHDGGWIENHNIEPVIYWGA